MCDIILDYLSNYKKIELKKGILCYLDKKEYWYGLVVLLIYRLINRYFNEILKLIYIVIEWIELFVVSNDGLVRLVGC